VRKIIIGLILILAVLFTIFSFGQEEVLSTTNIEPEVIEKEPENKIEENPVIDQAPPKEPVMEKPERDVHKVDLTYDEVVQLINTNDKKFVDNPNDILVLVNKENNLQSTYVPEDLVIPNVPFSFQGEDQKKYMRQDAASALEALITKAEEEGHKINAVSGYRSYERQKSIFLGNVKKHGFKKANTFSAMPGQSEHQTGLAMDVSCASVNYRLVENFGDTPEGRWLNENAHHYGFIIRYSREKVAITGYQYEPWHIRYVGVEAATEIVMNDLTLEEYLQ
jgi:D-alanyl-D-alanine carboxypeptidase